MLTRVEEIKLLAQCALADNRVAFGRLVEAYRTDITRFFLNLTLGDHALSDDLAQETFIKAYLNIRGFKGLSKFRTWLYRIAVNESLSLIRSRRTGLFSSLDDGGASFDRIVSSEGLFDGEEAERALARAVGRLPAKQRAVFTLRYWDEMPYEQMSAILDTSVGALKASYHHAVTKVEQWVRQDASGADFFVPDDDADRA